MAVKSYLRGVRDDVQNRWHRARHRWSAARLEEDAIAAALAKLPIGTPAAVCVHSSLSACGYVEGGAATVVRALRQWNRDGVLMMPAHSYCYPTPGQPAPIFDPAKTPSVVGAITDAFWRQPGVRRSLHPTHSLAVEGADADRLLTGHEQCDTPCGAGTPYERLVAADCAVLMFGATLDAYTLFHTAEDAAGVRYLYEASPVSLRYLDASGDVRTMLMRKHDMTVTRSFRRMDAWLEARGLLHRVTLGDGELLLIPHTRSVHDATVAELRRADSFLRAH